MRRPLVEYLLFFGDDANPSVTSEDEIATRLWGNRHKVLTGEPTRIVRRMWTFVDEEVAQDEA